MSAKRRKQLAERTKVRGIVLARANFQCEYRDVVPEIECGWLPDRLMLEVDELRGGSYRNTEWLDPDRCVATCPKHHDDKSARKREIVERLMLSREDG